MIIGRQWMTNSFKATVAPMRAALVLSLLSLVSCNPTEITSSGMRANGGMGSAELTNKAYIFRDSPAILKGSNYGPSVNMKSVVDGSTPEFITDSSLLKGDCTLNLFNGSAALPDCLQTYASKTAAQQLISRKSDGSWIYPTNSSEFYQVNGQYHVQQGINTFFDKLKFAYDTLHSNPTFMYRTKATPKYLPDTGLFWFQAIQPANDNYFRNSFLSNYALCNLELNAQFNPAGPELCFGKWSAHPSFFFIQDPSIIYHELGHALIAVMMNFRNGIPGTPAPSYHDLRSNLGGYGYDEAGSIGEGVADYFSFVMNQRTHIGEWALKKSVNASRPMSEDDSAHIHGIDTSPEGRLSYPQYLLYDPNDPNVPFEDVHYAGQIVSHYLVALTKALQTECALPTESRHEISTSYVMMVLAETFSELGDLRSVGVDTMFGTPQMTTERFTNLDEFSSFLWSHVINPPTYRRFFQIMAKNINRYISSPGGLCQNQFTKDESEKLLDDYGLLLFKTYNDDGTSTKSKLSWYDEYGNINPSPFPRTPTEVHENNRRKSVLISKELLSLAPTNTETDTTTYYIIDDQTNMAAIMQNLLFKGFPMNPSTGVASVEYNNANIRISPGEIVAVIPNLFNGSNSTMAGVQLLATDWDHVHITDTTGQNGNFKPCVVDNVTTTAQGAEDGQTCTTTMTTYKRHTKNSAGFFSTQAAAPACLVQLEEGEVTRWVSQNEFRRKQGLSLEDKDCLGYGGTAYTTDFTFNPHECLVRVLPAANEAFFSKIDPQKSYVETVRNGNPDHTFGPGNAIIMEVNKWIPPGTKFRCRFRAKFSNCSDCFTDPTDSNGDGIPDSKDDYIDAEYNGAKPYKIINFEFDVND